MHDGAKIIQLVISRKEENTVKSLNVYCCEVAIDITR